MRSSCVTHSCSLAYGFAHWVRMRRTDCASASTRSLLRSNLASSACVACTLVISDSYCSDTLSPSSVESNCNPPCNCGSTVPPVFASMTFLAKVSVGSSPLAVGVAGAVASEPASNGASAGAASSDRSSSENAGLRPAILAHEGASARTLCCAGTPSPREASSEET